MRKTKLKGAGKREKGVSPVVATILLIALVIIAVASIAAFLGRIQVPEKPLSATISIDNAKKNKTALTIKHTGGDGIIGAFYGKSNDNFAISPDNWNNMEVRINGAKVGTKDNTTKLNGENVKGSLYDFKVGDVLYFELAVPADKLSSGDVITIIYVPVNQVITEIKVP